MKNEKCEVISGSFKDFAGKEHQVIVVAISQQFDDRHLKKRLLVGYSICHPDDPFNMELGIKIAKGQAYKGKRALYSTELGLINGPMVRALINQELTYICNNPDKFIKGYKEAEEKFNYKNFMDKVTKDISEDAALRDVVTYIRNYPEMLDIINQYIEYHK